MRRCGASGWSSCGSRWSGTRPAASAPLHVVAHRVAHVADPVGRQAEHLEGRGEDGRIGLHHADDLGVDDDLHRHPATGADLAHALGGQDPFDLTRSVGHHTERHASPLQVEQRRHRGGQRVAPEVRRPHLVERDRGRHGVVGRAHRRPGPGAPGRGPSRRARWPARPGPACRRSGPARPPRDAGRRRTGGTRARWRRGRAPPARRPRRTGRRRSARPSAPLTRSSRTASARRARPG